MGRIPAIGVLMPSDDFIEREFSLVLRESLSSPLLLLLPKWEQTELVLAREREAMQKCKGTCLGMQCNQEVGKEVATIFRWFGIQEGVLEQFQLFSSF